MVRFATFLLVMIMLVAQVTTSCTPIKSINGFIPDALEVKKLRTGIDKRSSVKLLLGEPMSVDIEGESYWIYLQQETHEIAFFAPQVKLRKVLLLSFDDNGILVSIENFDISHQNKIKLEDSFVKTEGRKMTVIQQIFGNVGNFSAEQFIN